MAKRLVLAILPLVFMLTGCELGIIGFSDDPPPTNGLYRSTDGGEDWEYISNPEREEGVPAINTSFLISDPTIPSTMFFGSSALGVFRTWDSGESWHAINTGIPATIQSQIQAIRFDPDDANTIYICGLFDGVGRIIRARNSGSQWNVLYTNIPQSVVINDVAVDPSNTEHIYAVASSNALLLSEDDGETWRAKTWFEQEPRYLLFDEEDPSVMVVYLKNLGILKSHNYGKTWTNISDDSDILLRPNEAQYMAYHPYVPERLYVGTPAGLFVTENRGKKWTNVTRVTPTRDPSIQAVAFHPEDRDTLFLAFLDGIYVTYNHGMSWEPMKIQIPNTINAIVVSGLDPDIMLAGAWQ